MEAESVQCETRICSGGAESKNEVFETDNVESKWNALNGMLWYTRV